MIPGTRIRHRIVVVLCVGVALSAIPPSYPRAEVDGRFASVASGIAPAGVPGSAAPMLPAGVAADWWTAVRAQVEADAYAVRSVTGTAAPVLEVDNLSQRWQARFTPMGVAIVPLPRPVDQRQITAPAVRESAAWSAGLRLVAYGAGDVLMPVEPVAPRSAGARVEFRYGESTDGRPMLTEWYVNAARGVEQGFTVVAAPAGSGPLTLALAITGGLRPVLDADGLGVELRAPGGAAHLRYADLHAFDASGRTLPSALSVPVGDAARIHIEVDTRGAEYPVTIDPLLTDPATNLVGAALGDAFGASVATAGDVNGDGYSDVVVGASGYGSSTGRVYLYLGASTGLSTTAVTVLTGEAAGNVFGSSVATAGDVNGDGYADVVVGARGYNSNAGRAYVYLGATGTSGLVTPAARTLTGTAGEYFGASVAPAGDVNGDTYADVVIGAYGFGSFTGRAYVFLGEPSVSGVGAAVASTLTGEASSNAFGASAATAGDVNGDGYADVIVGAYNYAGGTGRAYVYLGGASGLGPTPTAATTLSGVPGSSFGYSVATAGDVDGDGHADVLVGGPLAGRADVYRGTAGASGLVTPAATTLTGTVAETFGVSVAPAGDVNGDGYADVVIGASGYNSSAGRASVYLGGPSGLVTTAAMVTTWTGATGDAFGGSVATAGDVNGDGYADVVVGAPSNSGSAGRAAVYLGGATSLSTIATSTRAGEAAGNSFGMSVATAGDVNGDGYADLIVGAFGYSGSTGRVYAFLGGPSGLGTTAATILTGESPGNEFGRSVATAGDVNNDGYADVIVGASSYGGSVGRAYVYLGSASGLATTAATILTGESNGSFGFSVATAGDVNGDGFADVVVGAYGHASNTGRAYVYFGGAGGLAPTATTILTGAAASDYFGYSVATAGDVNRDGYADVVIGAFGDTSDRGRVSVYLGGASGLVATAAATRTGEAASDLFGFSVASAGDVNGDSCADVVVGAYGYSGSTGRAYVYLGCGGAGGLAATAPLMVTGTAAGDGFGYSVATAGDVNGDGFADVIVGASMYGAATGRAYLYLGEGSGLAAATLTGEATYNYFGRSVATAGDVNGDGFADVVVGADSYSGSTGRAYVYAGNGGLGRGIAPRSRRVSNTAPVAFGGQSDSATAFRLAALGYSPFGRTQVKLEWDVKPIGSISKGTSKSATWHDTSTGGAGLDEVASGLVAATSYRWRVRVLYRSSSSPFVQHSRWVMQPWGGFLQARVRTKPVAGATPTVIWTNPSAVTYGTPLGAAQLNAWANVAGAFAYTPHAGETIAAGTQTLSVMFTPGDAAYTPVTRTVTIDVTQATAAVTLGALSQTYDGTARAATATTAPAGLPVALTYQSQNIAGAPVATPPTNAGSYTAVATITDPNYQGSATATLVVAQATPVITWANPASIVYGTPLGATQLNATSNVPGTLLYQTQYGQAANGLVLPVGTGQGLKAQFTPTDELNYKAALKTATIDVLAGPTYTAYLAEGATSTFFDTRLALLNPGPVGTSARVTFSRSGADPVTTLVAVPGRTRVTLDPKVLTGMATAEFSTKVESDQPLIVDRTLSWDASGYGAHAETAVAAPALTWYLAEGATHSGFSLFYLLQNPNAAEAEVRVRFLRPSGAPLEKTYTLPPASRNNIWVNEEDFPGLGKALAATDVSAILESLNNQPIIVERALYLDLPGQTFGAGHESAGVTAPATQWFLAEGNTGPYFDLFVLIANPGEAVAQIEATYLRPDGTVIVKTQAVAANSRFNIWVDGEDPLLADTAVSTTIRSTNGVPVIVERALWWPGSYGQWYEAHNSPGATATGTRWALAEGEVGGTRGMDTYILLANTSPAAGDVRVTLLFENGPSVEKTFSVAANSRFNVDVRSEFATALDTRFGAIVESIGATPAQIVVERAMYWDAGGQHWAAGTNALATRLQ